MREIIQVVKTKITTDQETWVLEGDESIPQNKILVNPKDFETVKQMMQLQSGFYELKGEDTTHN